ncbi:hypothetical protein AWC38_SpisGene20112 [Stylophora pistillata]|uniref:Uncharacterized protein n=1 Tax=Stylophora pistillata TaxID=50429 RepID=A0A2B4RHB0_STYPI|nr:hypothetical protein AWC38_SpisGene20112 [Stylophora pistillata]
MVDVQQVGTEAVVTSNCSNPKYPKPKSTWHSQPFMPGTKLPAEVPVKKFPIDPLELKFKVCKWEWNSGSSMHESEDMRCFSVHKALGSIFSAAQIFSYDPDMLMTYYNATKLHDKAVLKNHAVLAKVPREDVGESEGD